MRTKLENGFNPMVDTRTSNGQQEQQQLESVYWREPFMK